MDISTKWISTEYRNIQFHVDIVTFEIATKKSNIKSLSSLQQRGSHKRITYRHINGTINRFPILFIKKVWSNLNYRR